jgi:WhiB family redox-sensing transcriptional regulator
MLVEAHPMALMWNRTVDWDADDWRRVAACRNTEPDLFFPVGTTGPAVDQIEAAKRVCRSCEALEPCLDFALATNQESGVWGGTSEEARRILSRAPARPRPAHRGARTGTEMATRVPPPSASGSASMEMVPSS